MAGLQGSGKTTTSGKLAVWLKKGGHRPMLVSVDVYRPAAREQLKVVAKSTETRIYEGDTKGEAPGSALVERLAKEARREATIMGCDTLIVDTAGRLGIDEELMQEMERLKTLLDPQEILFVADAMTGQDAVNSAQDFHKRLGLTGVVLTKMDGDARGGAALSIRHVTGQPIKFIGVGEKPDAFEPFHPDRITGRIMGHGDMPRRHCWAMGFRWKTSAISLGRSRSWVRWNRFLRCCLPWGLLRACSRPRRVSMRASLCGLRR
jgi:signal recognition particle subunit SRP54